MAERALNSGGNLSGVTTGLDSDQRQDRRHAPFRPDDPRRASGHGQDLARHQHRLQRRAALDARHGGRDRAGRIRSARRSRSSAWKCRADQLATRILAEQSRISSEALRMGKISRSRVRAARRARRPSWRTCRCSSTIPAACRSARCTPACGGCSGGTTTRSGWSWSTISSCCSGSGKQLGRQPRAGNLGDLRAG